jgi:DNA-binding transcriptional LysR family regulator
MSLIHLRNAEIFCDVIIHHGFSRAAEMRQISQPAVSQAVQQLEEHLGVRLIDRSRRPPELTAAGSVFFERVRKWLDEYRSIEDALQKFKGRIAGRLRVVSIYSVGLLQMSRHVRHFTELHPDVEVKLDYTHPEDVYARVLRDEAELGIVSFPRDGGDVSCIHWLQEPMVVVVPPEHEFANLTELPVQRLMNRPFVGFTSDLTIRRVTDRMLRTHHVTVNVVHQFDNVENVKRAVEVGAGIAILPEPTLEREIAGGTLKAVPIADVEFFRPLGIIHKRNKNLSTAAEKFVEMLLAESGTAHPRMLDLEP